MFPKTDRLIRILLIFLLAFAPLAFGSVEPWSLAVLIVNTNLITLIWIARELRYPDESRRYRKNYTHFESPLPRGLFIVSLLIVGLVAIQLGTSLIPSQTLIAGATLVSLLGLFFAVLNTNLRFEDTRAIITALMTVGFFIALLGILQKLSGSHDLLWIRPQPPERQIFGPYVSKNHFAGLMTLLIPLGLGLFLAGGDKARGEYHRNPQRTLLGFALIVMTGALLFSFSRGGTLSVAAVVLLMGFMLTRIFPGRHRRTLIALAAASTLVFALWLGGRPLLDRMGTVFHLESDGSFTSRTDTWRETLPIIQDYPFWGTGLGTYGALIETYRKDFFPARFVHAHNDHLQLMAEFGLVGYALFSALFILWMSRVLGMLGSRRSRRVLHITTGAFCSIIAFLIHNMADFNFHIPANAAIFAVVAAITLKTACTKIKVPPKAPKTANID